MSRLENTETKLALAKSDFSKVKTNEWKLLEMAMQDGDNKALEIVRNFHLERDLGFLKASEEDTEDTSFNKDSSLATRASDHPSISVESVQLADSTAIYPKEAATNDNSTINSIKTPPPGR